MTRKLICVKDIGGKQIWIEYDEFERVWRPENSEGLSPLYQKMENSSQDLPVIDLGDPGCVFPKELEFDFSLELEVTGSYLTQVGDMPFCIEVDGSFLIFAGGLFYRHVFLKDPFLSSIVLLTGGLTYFCISDPTVITMVFDFIWSVLDVSDSIDTQEPQDWGSDSIDTQEPQDWKNDSKIKVYKYEKNKYCTYTKEDVYKTCW